MRALVVKDPIAILFTPILILSFAGFVVGAFLVDYNTEEYEILTTVRTASTWLTIMCSVLFAIINIQSILAFTALALAMFPIIIVITIILTICLFPIITIILLCLFPIIITITIILLGLFLCSVLALLIFLFSALIAALIQVKHCCDQCNE